MPGTREGIIDPKQYSGPVLQLVGESGIEEATDVQRRRLLLHALISRTFQTRAMVEAGIGTTM